jgi:hypothetical protein
MLNATEFVVITDKGRINFAYEWKKGFLRQFIFSFFLDVNTMLIFCFIKKYHVKFVDHRAHKKNSN